MTLLSSIWYWVYTDFWRNQAEGLWEIAYRGVIARIQQIQWDQLGAQGPYKHF